MFDHGCLPIRYSEDAETMDHLDWICPKCHGICSCSLYIKKCGKLPTGQLSTFIKVNGSDAAKALIKADNINSDILTDYEGESEGEGHDSDSERPAYSLRTRNKNASKAVAESFYGSESSGSGDDSDMDPEPLLADWSHCPPSIGRIVLIDE
ncbi:hypothetical protein EV178_002968 [Coemansia sp. RSA 1646]|nr:hypothetical protein EV178_002968 [Coemansia sp. RSA 1646]KAJ2213182.1 hypothetical protein EV179_004057 [Coemansia sp. RSA 487]